jgi:hypothetical protein
MVGSRGEARPIVGLSSIPVRASLTGNCGVMTGGLRVSMRFMGPEEGGVVAVSRTPRLSLAGEFAAGASRSDAASPSEAKSRWRWQRWIQWHMGGVPLLIWVSLAFYIFSCTWKLLPPWLPWLYMLPLGGDLAMWAN